MEKALSLALVLTLVLAAVRCGETSAEVQPPEAPQPAYDWALSLAISDNSFVIDEDENFKLITAHTDEIKLVILTDPDTNYTEAALSTYNDPDTVYQIYIDNYTRIYTGTSTTDFVNAVIRFMINNEQDIDIVHFSSVDYSVDGAVTSCLLLFSIGLLKYILFKKQIFEESVAVSINRNSNNRKEERMSYELPILWKRNDCGLFARQ